MIQAFQKAAQLVWSLDRDLLDCVRVSLQCSLLATAAATLAAAPIAAVLGRRRFRGRRAMLAVVHTSMAVPTVVIGLVLYGLFSRAGPLGATGMLYSPALIVAGEFLLALPVLVALFSAAAEALDARLEMTARTLGAGRIRCFVTVLREGKVGFVTAIMSAFGRVCSELGIAMIVGGNIKGYTRTITTAMAAETAGGDFALALALGLVLVVLALGVNLAAQAIRLPARLEDSDVL